MSYGMNGSPRGPAGSALQGNSAGSKEKIPSGYKKYSVQQWTPEAVQNLKGLWQHVGPDSYLARLAGGDQSFFDQMEAPAHRQFQEQQGQLGSRFSQLAPGAMSAQRGSGFSNAANQQTADFSMGLAARRQELQQQAIKDLMGLSHILMNEQPYENGLIQKEQKQGFDWGGLAGAGIGAVGGFLAGGPMGAFTGASIGHGIGSGIGSNTQYQSSPGWNKTNYGQQGMRNNANSVINASYGI